MSTLTQFFGAGGIPATAVPIEALIVGGGGSGGICDNSNNIGGSGGGAGLFVEVENLFLARGTTYTIAVGGGGNASNGSPSSLSFISAIGGGRGGGGGVNNLNYKPWGGGSGGGGYSQYSAQQGQQPGGTGAGITQQIFMPISALLGSGTQSPCVIRSFGSNGGLAYAGTDGYPNHAGAGGGGAGTPGGNAVLLWTGTSATAGASRYGAEGGAGRYSSITGTSTAYAGGGGGSTTNGNFSGGEGGGGSRNNNGAANTGGGGGGSFTSFGTWTSGGSGIVIIAYPDTYPAATVTGSPSTPSRSGYRVYRFTGSGSILIPT